MTSIYFSLRHIRIAKLSCVNSSTTLAIRYFLPSCVRSSTKALVPASISQANGTYPRSIFRAAA